MALNATQKENSKTKLSNPDLCIFNQFSISAGLAVRHISLKGLLSPPGNDIYVSKVEN